MGEATWQDKCPCCGGKGKLQTRDSVRGRHAEATVKPPTPCENCGGTGIIYVVKKLKKRTKDNE